MIPQIGAPTSVGSSQQQPSGSTAGHAARQDAQSVQSRASGRETARAVEPPQPANNAKAPVPVERRNLNPPDPNAPAGPPPAFEASILDRRLEEALNPPAPDLSVSEAADPVPEAPEPVDAAEVAPPEEDRPADASAEAEERPESEPEEPRAEPRRINAYSVPPSAELRAELDVATIRRIETPYAGATIDVSR